MSLCSHVEKAKHNDALSDICYVLTEIKEVAIDVGLVFKKLVCQLC